MEYWCLLAPTLFSLYLSPLLEVAFKHGHEDIYVQTRQYAYLFSVSKFRAKTPTNRNGVRKMLLADDSEVAAHSSQDMQKVIAMLAKAAAKISIKKNIKKTECLYLSQFSA